MASVFVPAYFSALPVTPRFLRRAFFVLFNLFDACEWPVLVACSPPSPLFSCRRSPFTSYLDGYYYYCHYYYIHLCSFFFYLQLSRVLLVFLSVLFFLCVSVVYFRSFFFFLLSLLLSSQARRQKENIERRLGNRSYCVLRLQSNRPRPLSPSSENGRAY